MTNETLASVLAALEVANLDTLYTSVIGIPEDMEDDAVTDNYALMFNVETDAIFFLPYAVNGNGWNKTAESQNPFITIGWVSASDIIMGDPKKEIADKLNYEFQQKNQ